ncbi:Hypothetical_protein [Hexamita inflata]|uniref:Hypothetical_protein n=1 Tax=Hexamita inflata TaxID=28002 RepID=A0AA86QBZ5_9EUKA|nr:Hypothetical protein HINF_LOCUS43595 [Hexamita inflata]
MHALANSVYALLTRYGARLLNTNIINQLVTKFTCACDLTNELTYNERLAVNEICEINYGLIQFGYLRFQVSIFINKLAACVKKAHTCAYIQSPSCWAHTCVSVEYERL